MTYNNESCILRQSKFNKTLMVDFKDDLVFLGTFSGTDFTQQMLQHSGANVFFCSLCALAVLTMMLSVQTGRLKSTCPDSGVCSQNKR